MALPLALLVEDDLDTAEMYATFLRCTGFRVATAESAAAGFVTAVTELPDVIVADVRLPGGPDGLSLVTELRLDRRTTSIPIIVLTGDAFPEHRAHAAAAGCDVFLTKPCLPTVLADEALTLVGDWSRDSRGAVPIPMCYGDGIPQSVAASPTTRKDARADDGS